MQIWKHVISLLLMISMISILARPLAFASAPYRQHVFVAQFHRTSKKFSLSHHAQIGHGSRSHTLRSVARVLRRRPRNDFAINLMLPRRFSLEHVSESRAFPPIVDEFFLPRVLDHILTPPI